MSRQLRETVQFWPALAWQHLARLGHGRPKPAPAGTIVSLTSYPARFETLHHCLASLLRQTVSPDRIVLVVAAGDLRQCPLPEKVVRLASGQIEILEHPDDLHSYKKLVPLLERNPGCDIVTCDDDKLYPPTWLERLLRSANSHPGTIICHRARTALADRPQQWLSYAQWPACQTSTPSAATVPIGSGGVLYPAGCLDPIAHDRASFMRDAPDADDLWFKLAAWRAGTLACQVSRRPLRFVSVPVKGSHLSQANLHRKGNDAVLRHLSANWGFTPEAVLAEGHAPSSQHQADD